MIRLTRIHYVVLLLVALLGPSRPLAAQRTAAPELLLRLDDVGMNHSVNLAIEKVAATGMPFSVSVLFACPWYQEAVEILRKYPNVAVGVHLALNSEWRNYRWGPVLGKGGVPSLVDSVGYFHPSRDAFLASKYDVVEVERELSAQVERAPLADGLAGVEVAVTRFDRPDSRARRAAMRGVEREPLVGTPLQGVRRAPPGLLTVKEPPEVLDGGCPRLRSGRFCHTPRYHSIP